VRPGRTEILKRAGWGAVCLATLVPLAACHSYHVDTTVENRSGARVDELEVDYPSASFGTNRLEPGSTYQSQIQFRNSGPLKVTYTTADGHQVQVSGPLMAERQEGRLEIVLLPGGKAEFHPHVTPAP
jgi:hypothetical protein